MWSKKPNLIKMEIRAPLLNSNPNKMQKMLKTNPKEQNKEKKTNNNTRFDKIIENKVPLSEKPTQNSK